MPAKSPAKLSAACQHVGHTHCPASPSRHTLAGEGRNDQRTGCRGLTSSPTNASRDSCTSSSCSPRCQLPTPPPRTRRRARHQAHQTAVSASLSRPHRLPRTLPRTLPIPPPSPPRPIPVAPRTLPRTLPLTLPIPSPSPPHSLPVPPLSRPCPLPVASPSPPCRLPFCGCGSEGEGGVLGVAAVSPCSPTLCPASPFPRLLLCGGKGGDGGWGRGGWLPCANLCRDYCGWGRGWRKEGGGVEGSLAVRTKTHARPPPPLLIPLTHLLLRSYLLSPPPSLSLASSSSLTSAVFHYASYTPSGGVTYSSCVLQAVKG
ncbi:unnamed protein product, partial [Closterium sp. NIES-53]